MTLFESNYMQESTFAYEEVYIQKSSRPVPNDQLIEIIAELLAEIVQSTANSAHKEPNISVFSAKKLPTISLKDYLSRMAKFSYCSQEAFIIALIFVDRLTSFNKGFSLNASNVHRYKFF